MDRKSWTAPTTREVATKRGVGRNRYNTRRRDAVLLRRGAILRMWGGGAYLPHVRGSRSMLARQFGVNRSTVARDFRWCQEQITPYACPTRRGMMTGAEWRELERSGRVQGLRFTS